MNKKLIITFLLILNHIQFIIAAPGDLDTTFANAGLRLTPVSTEDIISGLAIQTDDKILIAGSTKASDPELFLARYTTSGILDTTFNTTGTQTLLVNNRTEVNGIVLQSDDKSVVAGFVFDTQTKMFVARYTTAGVLDTSFNGTGYNTQSIGEGATANAVGLQSTGEIIIAGTAVIGGIPHFALARFSTAGALDATFGTSGITTTEIGTIASIAAIAIDGSDNIVVVGNANNQITLARYTSAGILDGTFGTGGIFQPTIGYSSIAYDIAIDSAGRIIVVGSAFVTDTNYSLVIRCTSSGALDGTFGTGGIVTTSILYGSEFYSVLIEPAPVADYITAAGYAVGALSDQNSLVQYTSAGVLDSAFGTSGITLTAAGEFSLIKDIKLQSTRNIITTGLTNDTFYVSKYIGS